MRTLPLLLVLLMADSTPAAQPLIVAHRGASHDAPENTLAAFKLAWEQGADAIEGDFYLTKDGKIICTHDKDMKRLAGSDAVVAKSTFDDLRKLDVGSWKDAKFAAQRMPSLKEVMATVPAGKQIFIEIKCGPEIVPVLNEELQASSLQPEQTVIIAFSAQVIAACKKAMPNRKAHWLTSYKQDKETKAWSPSLESILRTLKDTKADGLDTNAHAIIDAPFVKVLRAAKLEFHCWTVDDPAVARRFIELGADSITTNRPAWLREKIKS
ncbi:MAG: glycerophosphodiester phosphodiesterase [Phycisphaeraceae bacterium]